MFLVFFKQLRQNQAIYFSPNPLVSLETSKDASGIGRSADVLDCFDLLKPPITVWQVLVVDALLKSGHGGEFLRIQKLVMWR